MANGTFREDLFYRLNVVPIHLPPLRERLADIVPLAEYFLSLAGSPKRLTAAAAAALIQYGWPGNVRELKNTIERAYIMCELELELQPMNIQHAASERLVTHDADGGIRVPIGSSLAQAERWLIEATLAHWAGNKNRAARTLGCSLKTLYNKLAIYERQGVGAQA